MTAAILILGALAFLSLVEVEQRLRKARPQD